MGNDREKTLGRIREPNWNHLTAHEKMRLWDCQKHFDNRLQLMGCPDCCIAVKSSDGSSFEYRELSKWQVYPIIRA